MQGTRVRALVWEDPTCHEATKPVRHNYWACALEPMSHNNWACVPPLLKPTHLEPVLHNKRSHCNEKPAHRNEEYPPLATTRENPRSNDDPTQPKNKFKKKEKKEMSHSTFCKTYLHTKSQLHRSPGSKLEFHHWDNTHSYWPPLPMVVI